MNKLRFIFIPAILTLLFASSTATIFAQGSIRFNIKKLKPGDSCTVFVNKDETALDYKKIGGASDSTATHTFNNLSNGKWSVKIDATGYYFPTARVVEVNNNNLLVEVELTPITLANKVDYIYEWKDDSSYVGHPQQSYINTPASIVVLNDTIQLPDDFSAVNLYGKFGMVLSNKITQWSQEDAFRLFQTVSRIPLFQTFGEGTPVITSSVWTITDNEVIDDIVVNVVNNVKYVTISRKAFVYANPSVVLLEGVRGKFYSKRLHHAVVAFATNFGYDQNAVSRLAQERYGFKFLIPNQELTNIMNEDFSNFQEFSSFEKLMVLDMLEELPDGMHVQTNLKYMARRIAGQVHPLFPTAAALAWTDRNTIEFMNNAFEGTNYFDVQRIILHEKAHFLWAGLFDQKLKDDWATIGGWYLDPTATSGWVTSKTTEFVSAYSHAKNPNEDMAESIAFYVLNPDKLMSRSIGKFEFIRDRIMNGTRYVAMIRKDLTFMVYNLFPDYNYPGKIKRVNVKVDGGPDEDKLVTLEVELNIIDSTRDGGSGGYTRFTSSIGTIFDIGLAPVNAVGSVLRGSATLSKYVKAGYWTVNQIMIQDALGNQRYENNTHFGLKLFVNNPVEDLLPPVYKENTLQLSKGVSKFSSMGVGEDSSGIQTQYVEAKFDVLEKNHLTYVGVNFAIPKMDEPGVKRELQLGVLNPKGIDITKFDYYKIDPTNNSLKHIKYRYPIPEYFPTGYYDITMMRLLDEGENVKKAFFMKDTSKFDIQPKEMLFTSKHIRDSIYIQTTYPDYIPPVLDVNAITISAKPTHPEAPDGETIFEMEFFAKDSSFYSGHESGIKNGSYILRDPQGKQHGIGMQADMAKNYPNFYYLINDPSGNPGIWRKYKVSTLLPRGSSPGLWGVESMELEDRAGNIKRFSFVELVRFDIEKDAQNAVTPHVAILNKKVNARNVDSIAMSISCTSCMDKMYRARIYSDMGGNSVVFEGKMTADSITIKNIQLKGVNDGILYATVFILDSSKALLGIGKSSYTKDVIAPKSSILKTNLSNFGKSNIDSLIVDMKIAEIKGDYTLVLKQFSLTSASNPWGYTGSLQSPMGIAAVGDSIMIQGSVSDTSLVLKNISLKNFSDGIIEIYTRFTDTVGNESALTLARIFKDTQEPIATIKKTSAIGRNAVMTITTNEYISNTPTVSDFQPYNAVTKSVLRINNKTFEVSLERLCADSFGITLKNGVLFDTVGNPNIVSQLKLADTLIPASPFVNNIEVCSGYTAPSLTATNTIGNEIVWYGNNITGGIGTLAAPIPSTITVGNFDYYVSQRNIISGCESSRAKIILSVKQTPTTPIISKDANGVLQSSASVGNQWYKDGQALTGVTASSYKPSETGNYTVITTQNGCSSVASIAYMYLPTGVVELDPGEFIHVHPNPFMGPIVLQYKLNEVTRPRMEVYNANGRKVFEQQNIASNTLIQLPSLTKGVYFIKIITQRGRVIFSKTMMKL